MKIRCFISIILFFSGWFVCLPIQAQWGWSLGISNGYYGPGYNPWYYGPGYYGWNAPMVVTVPVPVPVPAPRYYVRDCETVQICNEYDECWLERECN
ncbi:hypothetical protein Lade_1268 [Legionella adelaidensis]|uniref:Glycine-rich protein n=1 Tax=Legionella adelaidensis TaxID=45056 RepID=A0A0W0R6C0_9GAMM|nr:hypothetical protein [Legionella adelaidensis]KTC66610.1 hypothetical protein Lade_1268 [Legionella adelaidensis]